MRKIYQFLFLIIAALNISCDNTNKIEDSRKSSDSETVKLEDIKNKYGDSIKTLTDEIDEISGKKESISESQKYSKTVIYSIIQNAHFDHIILGTADLKKSSEFFSNDLGFKIKDGKKHKNGISNIFIEFRDSSEIEFIQIKDPLDHTAKAYNSSIKNNNYGLQFAMRVNKLEELYNHFKVLDWNYSSFLDSRSYSILSQKDLHSGIPMFFIKHHQKYFNELTVHENKSSGINSIWLGSKELRKDILELVDYGFTLVDTVRISVLDKKAYLMRNNYFKIILFESDKKRIEGITILTEGLDFIKQKLIKQNIQFNDLTEKKDRSIIIAPQVTNSIYFEFVE